MKKKTEPNLEASPFEKPESIEEGHKARAGQAMPGMADVSVERMTGMFTADAPDKPSADTKKTKKKPAKKKPAPKKPAPKKPAPKKPAPKKPAPKKGGKATPKPKAKPKPKGKK